jgi:hypothetical protein
MSELNSSFGDLETAAASSFSRPLKNDDDGLRGFEVKDGDGYVLFFGRPVYEIMPNNVLEPTKS